MDDINFNLSVDRILLRPRLCLALSVCLRFDVVLEIERSCPVPANHVRLCGPIQGCHVNSMRFLRFVFTRALRSRVKGATS